MLQKQEVCLSTITQFYTYQSLNVSYNFVSFIRNFA